PLFPQPPARSVLTTGFPYSLAHASTLAALLAELLCPPVPRKGLVTDLDDTLWAGLLDEAGPQEVSWTEAGHRHGLYQQLLASLASAGVLIGVASRHDPALVAEALDRPDLLIARDALYPVEVAWGAKSHLIQSIVGVWNVAAEDGLRMRSVRAAQALHRDRAVDEGPGDFLAGVAGTVEFHHGSAHASRALALIGKANQFNLNGRRWTEADLARVTQDGGELVTVSYGDRYGPLGVIAALLITPDAAGPAIDAWVMSCRAFGRRVEHHTLRHVFDRFAAPNVSVAFAPTARNVAVRHFLASLDGHEPQGELRLTREAFERDTPALVHRVIDDRP
ncbi:MAG: hypothetical protein ACRDPM_16145, partial [Solirubrobacteraceae bacterium]